MINPVLRKDILGLLRLKRVAAIQVFFILVLSVMVLATWPQSGVIGGSVEVAQANSSINAGTGDSDGLVRRQDQLLLGLVVGQIVLLVLFVPGIAATALTGEKEANTLEMLYASRLTPGQIIWGKVALSIAYPLLLLISGLPFVALLNYRGDVQSGDLLWSYVILVVTAIFLGMLSLVISAVCRQSSTALVAGYVVTLTVCGGVLVPAAIMLDQQGGPLAGVLHGVRAISPIAAALSLLRPHLNSLGGSDLKQLPALHPIFIVVAVVASAGCFMVLVSRLRRPPQEALPTTPQSPAQRSLGRRLMYLIDPKKRRKPFGTFNPILGKERRTSNLGSGSWLIRLTYAALFLSLALAAMALYGGSEYSDLLRYVVAILVSFQMGIIALVVPSLTSSTISNELENGTFEILRLAPLRGSTIFWGKFIPSFLPALLPNLALLPAYGAITFIDHGYIPRLVLLVPVIAMAVLFCCTLGLTCSTWFNNTARATVTAYVITAAVFVLPMLVWWASPEPIPLHTGKWIAAISPLVIGLNLLPASSSEVQGLYGYHLWIMGGACVGMLLAARIRLAMLLRHG